ncbi:MAG TPA: cytochrome c1 [Candidatus Binatia bacterium]|nr:cytochrome c1 [Candidatus Binatia bacterium]
MKRALWLALALAAAPAVASENLPYSFKANTANLASLQRGARDFMAYCSGCHSLKYLRYNRIARDLAIPEDLVQANLMINADKLGDTIRTAMPAAEAEKWFGRTPPDLSLSARERGADWIYSYLLSFYADPSRPRGVDNLVLPGVSMPHVLGELQGWQVKPEAKEGEDGHGEHHAAPLVLAQPGTMKPDEYKALVGDLTNFLVYAAEPGRNARMATGVGVLLFMLVFSGLAYLLKAEYWKDVH